MDDLLEILTGAWRMLQDGVEDDQHPCRTALLATTGPAGASLRTVVLRQVIEAGRLLRCYTDVRSAKVAEIQRDPRVSWLVYHPGEKVQLRLSGRAVLHMADNLAKARWQATPDVRRQVYRGVAPPGTPLDDPTAAFPPPAAETAPDEGWENFAVLSSQIDSIDWLYVGRQGHRRAKFRWQGDEWTTSWVVP